MQILLIISLTLIAFSANAFMDRSSEGKLKNKKLNKADTWKNKYKTPLEPYRKVWYYPKSYKPNFKEKYPLSSTWLSFTSDIWHFAKFVFIFCFHACLVVLYGFKILIFSIPSQLFAFSITYNYILKKYMK